MSSLTVFTTEQGELVKPEYSNAGTIALGCFLRREDGSSITGMITCERIGRAYWANEEGWVIQEFWIREYQQINGTQLRILQAEAQQPKAGDKVMDLSSVNDSNEVYIKYKEGLLQLRTDAAGRIEKLIDSNDPSHQYALLIFFILLVVFLAISGFFKFKSH